MKNSETAAAKAGIRNILATTDFSNESRGGVRFAVALGDKLDAAVTLVYVIEPPSAISGMEAVPLALTDAEVKAQARAHLFLIAEQERGQRPVKNEVRIGKPFREIVDAARRSSADLIVIATHGYTGAKRAFMGSTAERVVRHAGCPVLTVPAGAGKAGRSFGLKKILVPIDFSKLSRDALPWAIALAHEFEAEVTLLHVVQKFPIDFTVTGGGSDIVGRLREQAAMDLEAMARSLERSARVKASTAVASGTPFDEICKRAKSLEADLIVLTTHGYTGLKHVWMGSTAERVVRHAACPVLVVRKRVRSART